MSATLTRPRIVPVEFIGLARDLIRRVDRGDDLARTVADRIWAGVKASNRAHGRTLADAAATWQRTMPETGCVSRHVVLGKHSLTIEELRLLPGEFRFCHWEGEEREPSVQLTTITLTCGRKRSEIHTLALAHVSLHGLARWYERTRDRSDRAFYTAMRTVAAEAETLAASDVAASDGFEIHDTTGRWVGRLAKITPCPDAPSGRIIAVRTFIPWE
jgi:hypothetical protein